MIQARLLTLKKGFAANVKRVGELVKPLAPMMVDV